MGLALLSEVLDQRIGTYVKRLEQLIIGAKTAELRPLDITVPQYAALLTIKHLQPSSAAQLARSGLGAPQSIATMLNNLENKGLIERQTSPIHQKLIEIRLTDLGTDTVNKADDLAAGIERKLRKAIGEELFESLVKIEQITARHLQV